jgi:lysyl-tRNA synthetase class I
MEILITGLLLALVSVIVGFLAYKQKQIIPYIESKFKIDISDSLEVKIDDITKKAILYAEEYAAKKAKEIGNKAGSKIDSKIKTKIESSEKLAKAVEFTKDFIPEKIKESYTDEKIAKLIESKIASMKDLGATQKAIGE